MKRFAARVLYDQEGKKRLASVVELEDGFVQSFYPLTHELPSTVWLEGEIQLVSCPESESTCQAYHLYKSDGVEKRVLL